MTTATLSADPALRAPERMPLAVQILSTLVFGAFAITATALAFVHFWPAGVILAVLLGWRGGFVPQNFTQTDPADVVEKLRSLSPEAERRSSGNTSFDAYRSDMLDRLEEEQQSFETFLEQLRDARDKREFDSFLDERAAAARAARSEPETA